MSAIVDPAERREALAAAMEFDHVVRVHPDGTVTDAPDTYAPELYLDADSEDIGADADLSAMARGQGWELLAGWSGQHAYPGPIMHASEYIGGRLADAILSHHGDYVAVVVECIGPDGEQDTEPAGWVIARRTAVAHHPVTPRVYGFPGAALCICGAYACEDI